MDLFEAESLARAFMDAHGLYDWKFQFDGAKRRNGMCSHREKIIYLSRHLTARRDPMKVRNTILHEIAHALVGPGHGHDKVWKAKAAEIGADPKRVSEIDDDERIPYTWIGVCPRGHIAAKRYRRPKAGIRYSCTQCSPGPFNPDSEIVWVAAEENLENMLDSLGTDE